MVAITLCGGPTVLIEYAGLRWLTDPTFSPPGTYGGLVKTTAPAVGSEAVEPVDVVLLSHDQHSDNLDPGGREFLTRAAAGARDFAVYTTVEGATRLAQELAGVAPVGLQPWHELTVSGPQGPVTVTAVPALHGPAGSEPVTGPVIGFVLAADDHETVYVSGDNASTEIAAMIAARLGPIDVAVLFAGAVQLPHRFDGAYLTLSSDRAAQAAEILGVGAAVPAHFEGWAHFTQGLDQIRAAFAGNGVSDRLLAAEPGRTVVVAPDPPPVSA